MQSEEPNYYHIFRAANHQRPTSNLRKRSKKPINIYLFRHSIQINYDSAT